MSKGEKDLFDVLGISTREDSYTTLLANLFSEELQGQEWARAYFGAVLPQPLPDGPVKARTRLHLRHENGRKADIPDLIFTFGSPVTDIGVVEAKIKSGESSDQLRRYEQKATQNRILNKLGLEEIEPSQVDWYYFYLTLEGEKPTESTEFRPIIYEPLCEILPSDPDLAPELFPAYSCLRGRLADYYKARDEVLKGLAPSPDTSLKAYLSDTYGLIDKTNRFHWLTKQIVKELGLLPEVGKTEQGDPFCQMRTGHWQGPPYKEGEVDLSECFDVHLELQLIGDESVKFVLHYETNPYMRKREMKSLPEEDQNEHWKRQSKFAEALNYQKNVLENEGWKLTHYPLQFAKRFKDFDLSDTSGTIGDFRQWLKTGTEAMVQPVEYAGKEVALWS